MKEQFLKWLRAGEPFDEGISLLQEHHTNKGYVRRLQVQGATPRIREIVRYDLMTLCGLKERELKALLGMKAKPGAKVEKSQQLLHKVLTGDKQAIKVRDEFPFLSDLSCPEELKILVSDKLTAYHRYRKAHARLIDCKDLTECYQVAGEVVEAYLENVAIYEELNHYKRTGEILGNHKIFARLNFKRSLLSMETRELFRQHSAIKNNYYRTRKKVNLNTSPKSLRKREERLAEMEWQLKEIELLIK